MDFKDIENKYSSSNLSNVVNICESSFSQDTQYRPRKSRKRLKIVGTSASLVIDQLKSVFSCPDDFMSRIKTRRNWRPEFLIKYLRDNRHGYNERCDIILRHCKRNLVPQVPKIYSIGLHSGAKSLNNNDLSSSCSAITNFKKRFSIVRRPMIACKYWLTQSTPASSSLTDESLKAHTDRQTITNCMKSTEIIPKYNQSPKKNHNSSHSQLHECIEKKENDTFRNDHAANDRSFIPVNSEGPFMTKDHKCGSCITRDVQIQTSNRKSFRRKRIKKRSKLASEKSARRKYYNYEPQIVTDFRTTSYSSSRRDHHDPSLRVRVLENKRAEYINKFTAVNQQIEEITATLRETCCSENSRNNLENCDEYFSSTSGDAKVKTVNWSGVGSSRSAIAEKRNTLGERSDLVNVQRIIGESKSVQCRNVQEILHVDNLNNETVLFSKDAIASSRNLEKNPNDVFGREIRETVYSSNRISEKKLAKCRFVKQMSFDLNEFLTKKEDVSRLEKSSIGDESFNKVFVKNKFAILNNDEYAKDLTENLEYFDSLEESRYRKKIVEKIGEVAILEDIKKRIDRDFDDPPANRSENDTEDFLTISQKSSNDHHDVVDVTSMMTIEEKSRSMPLSSSNLDQIETQIHDSMSIGTISEYSNKNSALSKYFSCTQSLISLTENENELAIETVDRSAITRRSHSNLHSNYHYYDSRSNLSLNNSSPSNLDSSFDIARYDLSSTWYTPPNKCLNAGTENEQSGTFEISKGREGFAKDEICEWKRFSLGESKKVGKEWQAEKRYTTDSTLETSKTSRYVGSIDSGVFSSSLIDLYPTEGSSFNTGKSRFKKKRRAKKLDGSSATVSFDSGSDTSYTDDTLDRKVNDVVRDLTKNLILCERRARMKLKARDARYSQHVLSRACKLSRSLYDTCCDFFNSPRRYSEDERLVSISTPSLLSLSDSENEHRESRRVFY